MEAQLRSYLNDHATAWWAYMKKGEWAEQIGSFTRDALYITIMFILIPTAALLLYTLLVVSNFVVKGFNLIAAEQNKDSKDKLSFFNFMSLWFAEEKKSSNTENIVKAEQIATKEPPISNIKTENLTFNRHTNSTNPSDITNENIVDSKKEVGLYQVTPKSSEDSFQNASRAILSPIYQGEEVELYGTFSSQPITNKVDEDSPF